MHIPPFFIRILGDLIPKEQREKLIEDVSNAAQKAEETANLCAAMHEQLQRMNEKLDSIQAVAVPLPDETDEPETVEPEIIPFDELETVTVTEPDFSEHPKYSSDEIGE